MEMSELVNQPKELLEAWLPKLDIEMIEKEVEIDILQSQIKMCAQNIENIKAFQHMIRMVLPLKTGETPIAPSLRMKKALDLVRDLAAERGNMEETLKELEELLAQAK